MTGLHGTIGGLERMLRVPSQRRPQYAAIERMAILQLRAMRGWNKTETARLFFVSDDTVRAGIHIGKTTVGRVLQEKPRNAPKPTTCDANKLCRIVSKYPGHTWHADLTAVPISGDFWTNWVPHAIWQRWPVCWWVLNVIDHFSRRSMGFAVFPCRPTSEKVTTALDRIMSMEQVKPKHLIVDQGPEFKCEQFENVWCKARNILPRFGAVNKHGSIAVVERFHRTLKEILLLITVPEHQPDFEQEVGLVISWYNEHRPHETLVGKTPNEVYYSRPPANERPRIKPRRRWPRGSPCAKQQVEIDGEPGDAILFELDGHQGHRHLSIIRVRPAA